MKYARFTWLMLVVLALTLAACGGGGDDEADAGNASGDNTEQTTGAPNTPASAFDLIDLEPVATYGTGKALTMAAFPEKNREGVKN
jgi:triosephosphate isomerase